MLFYADTLLYIIKPSICWRLCEGNVELLGPKGTTSADANNTKDIVAGLHAVDALIEGEPEELSALETYFQTSWSSRSTAFWSIPFANAFEITKGIESIQSGHVTLLGCGGIGSNTAMILAGAGVRKLRLIDFDVVEASNLNRQLFFKHEDIGRTKIEVLAQELNARFSHLTIDLVQQQAEKETVEQFVKNTDLMIVTADEPRDLTNAVWSATASHQCNTIATGYLFEHSKLYYGRDFSAIPEDLAWEKIDGGIMPSYGPTNVEIAAQVAALSIQALAGFIDFPEKAEGYHWNNLEFPRKPIKI